MVVAEARRRGRLVRRVARGRGGRQVIILWLPVSALHGGHVARLRLPPKRSRHFAVAEAVDGVHPRVAMAVSRLFAGAAHDVILAVLDSIGAEETVQLVAVRGLVDPILHRLVHVSLHLDTIVADGGVVKGPDDVVDDFVYGNTGVLPCVEDAAMYGQQGSKLSSWSS